MILNSFMKWLKVVITLFCLILLLIGFLLGYIYSNAKNGNCAEKPFSYGIHKLNKINNANFTCSCTAIDVPPFSFNENGLVESAVISQYFDPHS